MLNSKHYQTSKEKFLYGYFILFLLGASLGVPIRFLVGQYMIAALDVIIVIITILIILDYEKRHDVNFSALILFWIICSFLFYYIYHLNYGLQILQIIPVPLAAAIVLNTKTFVRHGTIFLILFSIVLGYGFLHRENYPYLQNNAFLVDVFIMFLFALGFSIVYHKSTNQFYDKLQESNSLLAKANEEKTYLLQEIHHRVKNNLNLMTSILGLQAPRNSSKEIRTFVKQNTLRIKSISLVHELLYQSEDLGNVNFHNYVDTFIIHILSLSTDKNINVKLDIDEAYFESNTIIHLGIILNELVTNSLKHAFPNNKGEITIRLKMEDDAYILEYLDSGVTNKDVTIDREGFGLKLLNLSVKQLRGTLKMNDKNNFIYSIYFKGKSL